VVGGPGAADLLRGARQVEVRALVAWDHERRVPEGVPFFALDDLRRERDTESAQGGHLLLGEASLAAGHLEFGREVAAEDDPVAAGLPRRHFCDHWLSVANRK
jgi:hypothetical protein